jgi:alkanesulfonate monooxygenase SsuD/methylene tetrahydromethanopterin reductase-like flavin-dependent oxidoreductase (luciferase family)
VRLGTSILVLPCLGPVLAARRLATLDVLSEGRVMCGAGAGWSHDELEALGIPFKGRNERGRGGRQLSHRLRSGPAHVDHH